MKKSDNSGLTLVEIIIVIAIMGILVGFFITSTNYIGMSQARGLANTIKTAIGQARIQTMGKYDTYLYIYKSPSDGCYYKEFWKNYDYKQLVRDKREKIGKNRPIVKYHIQGDSDTDVTEIGSGVGLLIKFNRSNGKEVIDTMPAGSTYEDEDGNSLSTTTSVLCDMIIVSYGSREYKIEIVPETGKISL